MQLLKDYSTFQTRYGASPLDPSGEPLSQASWLALRCENHKYATVPQQVCVYLVLYRFDM